MIKYKVSQEKLPKKRKFPFLAITEEGYIFLFFEHGKRHPCVGSINDDQGNEPVPSSLYTSANPSDPDFDDKYLPFVGTVTLTGVG